MFQNSVIHLNNSSRQKDDMNQVPYRKPTNIRRHCPKSSHLGDLAPEICAPLVISVLVTNTSIISYLLTLLQGMDTRISTFPTHKVK